MMFIDILQGDTDVFKALGATQITEVRDNKGKLKGHDVSPDIDLTSYDTEAALAILARLKSAKSDAKRRVIAFADTITDKVMAGYPKAEVASWPEQAVQARRIVVGGETLGADELLMKLADKAGVAVTDYAAAVLVKAASFEAVMVEVKALRDQSETAIDTITDAAEIEPLLQTLKTQAGGVAATLGLA